MLMTNECRKNKAYSRLLLTMKQLTCLTEILKACSRPWSRQKELVVVVPPPPMLPRPLPPPTRKSSRSLKPAQETLALP